MSKISIGNILKNMRNNTCLSQKDISKSLCLADNTISSYERENSQPDFQTIVNYAELCQFKIQFYNTKTKQFISIEDLSKEP